MEEAGNVLSAYVGDAIHNALMQTCTGFFAVIISLKEECSKATIQPLNKAKQAGKDPFVRSIVTDAPVLYNARYRLIEEERDCMIDGNQGCTCSMSVSMSGPVADDAFSGSAEGTGTVNCSCSTEKRKHLKKEWIKPGDIAYCVCSDRDISETKKGKSALPKLGHHELKDAVIVGVM